VVHPITGDPEVNGFAYDYRSTGERLGQDRMVTSDPSDGIFRPYATDANGTVQGLEDQNGRTGATADGGSAQYETNPYGEELNSSTLGEPAQSNPFRFQGFYYDAGLKTYDMQARVYRPATGRFLSADRFESALGDFTLQTDHLTQNRYAFAGGNPVNHIEWAGILAYRSSSATWRARHQRTSFSASRLVLSRRPLRTQRPVWWT
jgi:RHS repeat-associated protein